MQVVLIDGAKIWSIRTCFVPVVVARNNAGANHMHAHRTGRPWPRLICMHLRAIIRISQKLSKTRNRNDDAIAICNAYTQLATVRTYVFQQAQLARSSSSLSLLLLDRQRWIINFSKQTKPHTWQSDSNKTLSVFGSRTWPLICICSSRPLVVLSPSFFLLPVVALVGASASFNLWRGPALIATALQAGSWLLTSSWCWNLS